MSVTVMAGTLYVPMYSNKLHNGQGERFWFTLAPEWSEEKAIANLMASHMDADRMCIMKVPAMPMYEARDGLESLQLVEAEKINYGQESVGGLETHQRLHADQDDSHPEVSGGPPGHDIQRVDSSGPEPVYSGRTPERKSSGEQNQ